MTAGPDGHGVRRLCIAFDLEHYSTSIDIDQVEKQKAMTQLVHEAGERGVLERTQWIRQEQGDGELALLPPGIDEVRVMTSLWREFREGLHRYNRRVNNESRLRMRVAAHEGMTYLADSGFAGTAINTVCRLRDSREAKDALRVADGDMVLVVSDRIYEDVIRGRDALDLPPAEFVETLIEMPDKGFRATAYIFSGTGPRPSASSGVENVPLAARPNRGGPGAGGSGPGASGGGQSAGAGVTFNAAGIRDVAETITHNKTVNHWGKL